MSGSQTLPPRAGIGLKAEHVLRILDERPAIGFVEIHAETYMVDGGPRLRHLEAIRSRYPLSIHGVGLSIGGEGPLDRAHLGRLKALVDRFRPAAVSEHLAWSSHGDVHLADLLPLPYTQATLARVVDHVDMVQQTLGRAILLENPSTYVRFAQDTIEETAFLDRIAERTGCGLLLDVNNVVVSAANHGFDPEAWLHRFPLDRVGEIHLAGHAETRDGAGRRLLIDAHGSPVAPEVEALHRLALCLAGPRPTLIEWDNDVPSLETLLWQQDRADDAIRAECGARVRA
jgi:uncharacterized protein